jgi:hypothetical protein
MASRAADAPAQRRLCEELERRRGNGHYDQRRDLLRTTLDYLKGKDVDFDAVLAVLEEAKRCQGAQLADREVEAARRNLDLERRLSRRLRPQLVQFGALLRQNQSFEVIADSSVVEMIKAIGAFEVAAAKRGAQTRSRRYPFDYPGPRRRKTRGAPPRDWLAQARHGLSRAGVSDSGTREDLLMAAGLRSYRPPAGPEV